MVPSLLLLEETEREKGGDMKKKKRGGRKFVIRDIDIVYAYLEMRSKT